jgi:hypothetical protein
MGNKWFHTLLATLERGLEAIRAKQAAEAKRRLARMRMQNQIRLGAEAAKERSAAEALAQREGQEQLFSSLQGDIEVVFQLIALPGKDQGEPLVTQERLVKAQGGDFKYLSPLARTRWTTGGSLANCSWDPDMWVGRLYGKLTEQAEGCGIEEWNKFFLGHHEELVEEKGLGSANNWLHTLLFTLKSGMVNKRGAMFTALLAEAIPGQLG